MNSYDFMNNILETDEDGITSEKLSKLASKFGYKKNKDVIEHMIQVWLKEHSKRQKKSVKRRF